MPITCKTHFNRSSVSTPGGGKDITFQEGPAVMNAYGLKKYIFNDFEFLAFESHFTPDAQIIVVPMTIPAFFYEIPTSPGGDKKEIHGLFLVSIGNSPSEANAFIMDKGVGKYGCPRRLLVAPGKESFSFNRMLFYPFVMTDFSVGYYICDVTASEPTKWPAYSAAEKGVSINFPVTYDATLGLYVTRDAHVVR